MHWSFQTGLDWLFSPDSKWLISSDANTIRARKWKNRGFLYGPVIPIYGIGALGVSICPENTLYRSLKDFSKSQSREPYGNISCIYDQKKYNWRTIKMEVTEMKKGHKKVLLDNIVFGTSAAVLLFMGVLLCLKVEWDD